MSRDKEIVKFRKKRASELKMVAKSLEGAFGRNIKTTSILTAAKKLEDDIPYLGNGSVDSLWGYEINDFKLPVETIKHVRPQGIKTAELTLDMRLVANFDNWGTLNDPLEELNFRILIRGIGSSNHYFGLHLDKHDMSKKSNEPHPVYHIQYNVNPQKITDFSYGSVLHIDTPRLMHYPLDFVLGIGFIISNFAPQKVNRIFKDHFFTGPYRIYQENIWKPYAHTMASHWSPFDITKVTWSPTSDLCPFII